MEAQLKTKKKKKNCSREITELSSTLKQVSITSTKKERAFTKVFRFGFVFGVFFFNIFKLVYLQTLRSERNVSSSKQTKNHVFQKKKFKKKLKHKWLGTEVFDFILVVSETNQLFFLLGTWVCVRRSEKQCSK